MLAGKLRAGHARPLRINNVLPCNNGTRPRNGQDRSLQSTRGPRSVGRGLDPSAAAVCHCDAVGAGHARPLRINNVLPCNNGTRPRNGQDRSLQSTRGPRSVGRGLDPSAAAVCHCDAVGAGHARPLRINNVLPCNNGTRPRNGQDRSLQSTRGPRSVGRGLDPSAAAVCHCEAVGAGHVRPAT